MSQNKNRIIISSILFLFCFTFCGCPDNNSANLGPDNENFVGTYLVRDSLEVELLGFVDSISFTVIKGTTYTLSFFEDANSSNEVVFCDHSGTIFDFGTAKASFVPTSIDYLNCDSAHIPRGVFIADFINYGDTIVLYRRVKDPFASIPYDSVFIMKLLK